MDEHLLPIEEAARRLGCKRSYLYALIRKGEIFSVKLGSNRRVPAREVERYANQLIEQEAAALGIEKKQE